MPKILFVCTGNICRSPIAQGILEREITTRNLSAYMQTDSAGTHAREGLAPDPFAIDVAARMGAEISAQRSRRLRLDDFYHFDWLVALDLGHLDQLRFMRPADATGNVRLLLAGMAGRGDAEVPDPYGQRIEEFEFAARLIDVGVRNLLEQISVN
jgi:protein-tyrosine phosphatase